MAKHTQIIDLHEYRREKTLRLTEPQSDSFILAQADFPALCAQEQTLIAEFVERIAGIPRCSPELLQLLANLSAFA